LTEDHGFKRYNSWSHCHMAFSKASSPSKKEVDFLALHLGAYLASWGMYRGSAFLLEFDYKVHIGIVKIVLKHKKSLLNLRIKKFKEKADEIISLHQEICAYYEETLKTYVKKGKTKPVKTSEILSTKIMLGTLGCIPAFDRFFKAGLKHEGETQAFSRNAIRVTLQDFAISNETKLKKLEGDLGYPAMKLLDMYFWQIGFDNRKKD
jgi:hypothetical protein